MTHSTPIQIIYAGGTFGSYGTPLSALASDDFLPAFKDLCQAHHHQPNFLDNTIIKDSSTLTPNDFVHFYQLILDAHKKGADKFLLITGTDTLAYLAAFLSIGLKPFKLTLVITGSMLPLFEPKTSPLTLDKESDAWHNLTVGLNFFEQNHYGSFVSFSGHIYHGNSVQKIHKNDKDAFTGTIFGDTAPPMPSLSTYQLNFSDSDIYSFYCLPNSPKLLADFFVQLANKPPSAVIVLGFGAGNMPASDELKDAIKTLNEKGFLLIMSSSAPYGIISKDYEAGAWQYSLGFVSGGSLSIPAIYGYALWLCLTTPAHQRSTAWQALFGAGQ